MTIITEKIIQYGSKTAAKLAQLMEKKGFGIRRLASESRLSRNRIRQILRGDEFRDGELEDIRDALSLSTEETEDLLAAWCDDTCESWEISGEKAPGNDIDHPERYGGDTPYECIKVLKAWLSPDEFRGFLKGNAIKYLCRIGKKDEPAKEAAKAEWYVKELEKSYKEE